ncbi:MBL fold metallo-hydrolase [Natronomonas marina]|uniref:MBL fold metallo-hydrolase n=1 Tax=Natronomonas marina TaxID=2961939 RepID=UPI0020C9B88B|nr:MBL fold metallo-hydrolase [Natronomonas marina]
MDGVHRIEVPTPFDIGTVNCYAFESGALTVIDPGPDTDEAYEALADGLARIGAGVEDVERILVTHPHMDHFGIAGRVRDESGASVIAHEHAAAIMRDMEAHFVREQSFFEPFLISMGVPESTAVAVTEVPEPYLPFQRPIDIDRTVGGGDIVEGAPTFTCVHTPGHAPGSLCYHVPETRTTFTGDHVMSDITPNPVLTVRIGGEGRTRSLPAYMSSLERLLSVDAERGYGGHREPIPDLHARVRETLDHHRERKEDVAELLEESGPATAYDLMREMFSGLPTTEVFLGMSEVIGHLDLLEDDGRVEITDEGDRSYYAYTGAT